MRSGLKYGSAVPASCQERRRPSGVHSPVGHHNSPAHPIPTQPSPAQPNTAQRSAPEVELSGVWQHALARRLSGLAVGLRVKLQLVHGQLLKRHAADARRGACARIRQAGGRPGAGGACVRHTARGACGPGATPAGVQPPAAVQVPATQHGAAQRSAAQASPVKQARTTSAPRPRASKIWEPL